MSYFRHLLISTLIVSILTWGMPVPAFAGSSCLGPFRARLGKVTEPFVKLGKAVTTYVKESAPVKAIDYLRKRAGRAQAEELAQFAEAQRQKAKEAGYDLGDPKKTWEDFVKLNSEDLIARMGQKSTYPTLIEMLWQMAEESATFKEGLRNANLNGIKIRRGILAHFMEHLPGQRDVKLGRRYWDIWNLFQQRVKMPARNAWASPESFAELMLETSNALFMSMNPEPSFYVPWLRAFGSLEVSVKEMKVRWPIMRAFAEHFANNYRSRYKAFMDGVALEKYGKARPDVMVEFYKKGTWETVFYRLAQAGKWTKRLATGEKLPEGFAKDAAYRAEIEALSHDMMFVLRPVITAAVLYIVLIDPAYSMHKMKQAIAERNERCRKTDDCKPKHSEQDEDSIKNFDEQIVTLSIQKHDLEKQRGSAENSQEAAQIEHSIRAIDRHIASLTKMRQTIIDEQTVVHE